MKICELEFECIVSEPQAEATFRVLTARYGPFTVEMALNLGCTLELPGTS